MRKIITTTGTSLLTNAAREFKKKSADVTDKELHLFWKQVGVEAASAETNSLLKIAKPDEEIVLLHTDTTDGYRCAREVERYLKSQNWLHVRLRKLPLENNEAQFESHGLRELVNILIDEISQGQRQNREVVINATGGFKAEIAYTTMVGMIFEVPIKYIYQNFQKPITFPALPVSWNIDLLLEYDNFFQWLDEEPRLRQEVEECLKAIPESERDRILPLLLPPDSEDCIYLSPAGEILWKRVNQQRDIGKSLPEPNTSKIPEKDKISNSLDEVKHHYPKGTLNFAQKIAKLAPVEEIIGGHFENTTTRRVKKVFDDGSIRVLWADNKKAANITIRTTARGLAQTLNFCDQYIRPLLDS
ncbi:putative CRISPR-associated protein [Calothrix sp. NIES-3974]|uniref:putative CRISPR-associated protein n=1 Tax=Calothrix sp. NIES-3974 TaxID=2005462 RepID=UPI000B5FAEA1|nr:putative CRISPR-associated protein [Calothrix sp. NIES-3974]BAZ08049.1 CRISPR-associated protein, APE2256 family [Calothrix sp. NIES-3974]